MTEEFPNEDRLNQLRDKQITADERLRNFYLPYFGNEEDTQAFIERCLSQDMTRQIMLMTQWYGELADKMKGVYMSAQNLQVLFLTILAEAIAKISKDFHEDRESEKHFLLFFEYLSEQDKRELLRGFHELVFPRDRTLQAILRMLYQIRCELVHNGIFFDFFFCDNAENPIPIIHVGITKGEDGRKRKISLEVGISYSEFRNIIVRTSINLIDYCLSPPSPPHP